MPDCYFCGTSVTKGQGARRNVRTGISVAGLFSVPPSFLLMVLAALTGAKSPAIRSYFALRTLCPGCAQKLDVQRALRRKIGLFLIGLVFLAAVAVMLTAKR